MIYIFVLSESVSLSDSLIRFYTFPIVYSAFYTLKYSAKGWIVATVIWGCFSEDDVAFFVPQQWLVFCLSDAAVGTWRCTNN